MSQGTSVSPEVDALLEDLPHITEHPEGPPPINPSLPLRWEGFSFAAERATDRHPFTVMLFISSLRRSGLQADQMRSAA